MVNQKPIIDRFKGKVAIVTGGTAGIGFEIARQLGLEGAKVLITGLPVDGQQAVEDLQKENIEVIALLGDMGDESFCKEVVQKAVSSFGRVDYLVNNAFSFTAKSLDVTRDDWHHSFNVGPFGFATMIQLCSAEMKKNGTGAVVNISSISGFVAQKDRWTYNCAKGAVNQLTKCAAIDLAQSNIRVNSVSPGWIWTREVQKAADNNREKWEPVWGRYHMFARLGEAVEIARPVLFLLSDDASFITGTDIPVDGGYQSMGPEGLGDTAKIAGSK